MSGSRSLTALVVISLSLAGCGAEGPATSISEISSGSFAHKESRPATESARLESPSRVPVPEEHAPLPPSLSAGGQFRSGTLTAGSLDDHAKFDEYSAYLSKAMQHDRRQELPKFSVGRRAVVRVMNEQGKPIGDARVAIRAADSGPVAVAGQGIVFGDSHALLEMTTGVDGQVVFLSGLDAPAGGSEFVLTVTPSNGGQPVRQHVSLEQTPWQVTLEEATRVLPRQLDLALVIDTTGSMGDELDYLKVEIDHIAAEIHERFPNVDQRYGLILYRDEGDEYVTRSFDFTRSLSDFRRTLAAQSAGDGGDYPEAMHLALENAAQLSWRGAGIARVAFLVADAPPHSQFAKRTLDAAQKLRRAGVTVFPVASSGVRDEAEFIMRAIGFLTQGQYLFLTDHSHVGNPHARPHAPNYSVEKLDQLMVRMIAEKLCGEAHVPQDIIAVEDPDQVAGVGPAVNHTSPQDAVQVRQPTVATTPSAPAATHGLPQSPTSPLQVIAEIFAALTRIDWWSIAQTMAIVAGALLLMVIERVQGV